jgi:hypothetical protein
VIAASSDGGVVGGATGGSAGDGVVLVVAVGSAVVEGCCVADGELDGGSAAGDEGSVVPGVPGVTGASCAVFGAVRYRADTWRQMNNAAKPKRTASTAATPKKAIGSFDERRTGISAPNGGGVAGDPRAGGCSGSSGGGGGAEAAGSGGTVTGRDPVDGRAAASVS